MHIENQIQICEIITALNGFVVSESDFRLCELDRIPVLLGREIPQDTELKLCEMNSVGKVVNALLRAALRCENVLYYLSENSIIFNIEELLGDRLKTEDYSLIKDHLFWDIFITIKNPSSAQVLLLSQSAEFFSKEIRKKLRLFLSNHLHLLSSEIIYYSLMTGVLIPSRMLFERLNELCLIESDVIYYAERLHLYGYMNNYYLNKLIETNSFIKSRLKFGAAVKRKISSCSLHFDKSCC
ncbi:MAG: hypothetical protein K6F99_08305 [Lachnospiraceae bacterium]|nr:hypothetical protein [Lachnospiraceae bacterium]